MIEDHFAKRVYFWILIFSSLLPVALFLSFHDSALAQDIYEVCGKVEVFVAPIGLGRTYYFFVPYGTTEQWVLDPLLSDASGQEIDVSSLDGQYVHFRGLKFDEQYCEFRDSKCVKSIESYEVVSSCEALVTPTPEPTPTPSPTPTPTPTATSPPPTSTPIPLPVPTPVRATPTPTPVFGPMPRDGYDPGKDVELPFGLVSPVYGATAQDLFYEGQCTWYVAGLRPDVAEWIGGRPRHAHLWDDRARAAGIPVDKTPQVGDIAVWESGCAGATEFGHVAYVVEVSSDGKIIKVKENNWKRATPFVRVEPCMHFIHRPKPTPTPTPIATATPEKAGDTQGTGRNRANSWWQNMVEGILGLIRAILGK